MLNIVTFGRFHGGATERRPNIGQKSGPYREVAKNDCLLWTRLIHAVRSTSRRMLPRNTFEGSWRFLGQARAARHGSTPGLFNALSERDGADSAVKDVFSLSEGKPV